MDEKAMDKYGWVIVMLILLGVGVAGTLLLLSRKTGAGTPSPTNKRKVTISAYANRLIYPDETSSCDIVIKSGNTEIGTIHYDGLDYFNPVSKIVYLADGDYTLVCYCPSKDYPKAVSYTDMHVASDMTFEVWVDLPEPDGYISLTIEILNHSSSGFERPFESEYKLENLIDYGGNKVPQYGNRIALFSKGVITAIIPENKDLRYINIHRYDQQGNVIDTLTIWTNIRTNTDIVARITAMNYSPAPGKILYEVKVFDKGLPVDVGTDKVSVYNGENPVIENLVYALDTYGEKGMVGVVQLADGNIGQTAEIFVKDKLGNITYAHITETVNTSIVYVLAEHTYKWR
jgi:hypothetical protein